MSNQKIVWITGASDGIGAALIAAFSTENVCLILSGRNEEKLLKVVEKNNFKPENYLILPFDLSEKNDYKILTNKVLEKFSTIDILILNAGVSQKSFAEETLETVERSIMETNYFSNVALSKAVLEVMKKQNTSGQIVVITSIVAKFGAPFLSTYSASKAALNNYFEALRYEIEKYKIGVLIVTPGFIRTNIDTKALTGDGSAFNEASKAQSNGTAPEKVAQAILSTLRTKKKHIFVGGIETLIPRFKFFFPNLFYQIWKKLHKI
jgi:short-subunit dehydrogenase